MNTPNSTSIIEKILVHKLTSLSYVVYTFRSNGRLIAIEFKYRNSVNFKQIYRFKNHGITYTDNQLKDFPIILDSFNELFEYLKKEEKSFVA